jgi:exodeoxyribonuclease V alpha subunit
MEQLDGVVERITFKNEENGFGVVKLKAKGFFEPVTIVGTLSGVNVGALLYLRGEWKNDGKFGKQFVVSDYVEGLPASVAGIEKYLGSGLIKGIGPVYAKKIVQQFKEDTLDIIEKAPHKLLLVEGLGQKKLECITKAWKEQKEIKNVMLFLQGQGVSSHFAVKIYKTYGDQSVQILQKNPYRLADDIWGIGFKTADTIAKKLGMKNDAPERISSGFLYTLGILSSEGHCFGTESELLEKTAQILELPKEDLGSVLAQMIEQKLVACEEEAIYPLSLYYSEMGVAKKVKKIMENPVPYEVGDVEASILEVEAEFGIAYDPVQKQSIQTALLNPFMVLTGGPGTGKTTTTLGIIRMFQRLGAEVLLAAPTGRAAKRMSEATGMEAKTVHRLLEYSPKEGYKRDEQNPILCDVLIVDESSMLDVVLANHLLKAVPEKTSVIMVGDVDQLPSVGPGNVLKDLIASGVIPVVSLKTIFRQAKGSKIIVNAHLINGGNMPTLTNEKEGDFFYMEEEDPQKALQTIRDLCVRRLPSHYGFDPIEDIQVLCPMQKGDLGARNLNEILQQALNRSEEWIKVSGITYKLGDKVMQLKNNYDKNVFNGDIGRISYIDHEEKTLEIVYDDQAVMYDGTELDEITLAYATTVHKSQGSEYKVVVAPIAQQHYILLQRNLLYTLITRAKRLMVLVGSKKAIAMAVLNDKIAQRNTKLSKRLGDERV